MALGIPLATIALLAGGGAVIGSLLSVLGAGGSILLLPLLVSGAALPTREAVPLSLLVVMLLALGNLGPYLSHRQFAPRPALILGVPALAGSWIGGSWVKAGYVPEPVQLGVFAAAALLASWLLTSPAAGCRKDLPIQAPTWTRKGWNLVLGLLLMGGRRLLLSLPAQGILVGLLTGIAGVGGGFAIVPALVLLAALGHWPGASLPLMLPLLVGGAAGAVIGQRLAPHLSDRRLRQGFAALLIGSALLSDAESVKRHQGLLDPTTGGSSQTFAASTRRRLG